MANKIRKYELYIGLNDKDTKTQLIDNMTAQKIVSNKVAQTFDGGTVSMAEGIYKHDDGTVVFENTLKVEILLFDRETKEDTIRNLVRWIKETLNQESVAVQKSIVNSELW